MKICTAFDSLNDNIFVAFNPGVLTNLINVFDSLIGISKIAVQFLNIKK